MIVSSAFIGLWLDGNPNEAARIGDFIRANAQAARGDKMKPKEPRDTDVSQSERFKQAARELGCDDPEERFGEIVTKLARAGPQHKPPTRKPRQKKP